MQKIFVILFLLLVGLSYAISPEDEFQLPDEDTGKEMEPGIYDYEKYPEYDPAIWGASLELIEETTEVVPPFKILKISFDVTIKESFIVTVIGDNLKTYLRTPEDASVNSYLEDPLVKAEVDKLTFGYEFMQVRYLRNASRSGDYSIRLEAKGDKKRNAAIAVYKVVKWLKIQDEEENGTQTDTEETSPENDNILPD